MVSWPDVLALELASAALNAEQTQWFVVEEFLTASPGSPCMILKDTITLHFKNFI